MLDQRITAATLRFAVLGKSLGHTWSPQIHNSLFAAAGIDAVYLPITVPQEKLPAAVDVLRSCFAGFNVTIPYKERIIPLLDEVDDAVRACGAVNTVENRDGRLIGHITDGAGMLRALEEGGVRTEAADALILGGGGAARAAGHAFLARGGRVTFAVRSPDKGEALAAELARTQADGGRRIAVCPISAIEGAHDVLLNCTPVGMTPHADACPVPEAVVARCGAVFDAVYNPRETMLLRCARRLGLPAVEGLGMLYHQAVEAERIWFEAIAPDAVQKDIYRELLDRM